MSSTKLSQLVDLDKRSINPNNFENTVFNVYSLPSYDQNKKPEKKIGGEIKSINNLVSSNTILFNKLNVRFKRIWNIHELDKESLCSGEFLRLKPQKCNQDYLYYFLQTESLTNYLIGASGGSSGSHSRISSQNLMALDVDFPDIRIQEKIASVLLSIDAKVEINNKIKGELEILAKMIYDYWFVQFDFPDENGKPYKSSGGKMVWSEEIKGKIPDGWEVKKVSELIAEDKSGDWGEKEKTDNYIQEVFCIRGADINGLNGKEYCDPPTRFISEKNCHKFLKPYDLIVEISGGSPTQSTGRIASISPTTAKRFSSPLICSNFCKALSLKDYRLTYNFYLFWNRLYDNKIFFGYEGKTSGIRNFLFDSFANTNFMVIPSVQIRDKFFDLMEIFEEKRQKILEENQKLTELRDWLLPMLMNGQIEVKGNEN